MKKSLVCSLVTLFLLMFFGSAHAALETIGTASYNGSDYNLIWDDDNNGNSVVWFDYTNGGLSWTDQLAWAADLDSYLSYNINAAYSVSWDSSEWRLPVDYDSTSFGLNYTTSEMGHLFYNELGLTGGQTNATLGSTIFDNLLAHDLSTGLGVIYWSSTQRTDSHAQVFAMYNGGSSNSDKTADRYGLAVRTGDVSVVPVPGTLLLLGSGLLGIAGVSRRRKCTHC